MPLFFIYAVSDDSYHDSLQLFLDFNAAVTAIYYKFEI